MTSPFIIEMFLQDRFLQPRHECVYVRKPRPVGRAGLAAGAAYSPFCLRPRDQIRVKVSPSGSSNRLA
jgi:hypothetical protein